MLWGLLVALRQAGTVRAAWKSVGETIGLRTTYRLVRRFGHVQTTLRQKLLRKEPAPVCNSHIREFAVIDHLKAAFPDSLCPVADYQSEFDIGLFCVPGPGF